MSGLRTYIFVVSVLLSSIQLEGQIESSDTTKYVWGWQLTAGANQFNFDALHRYDFLLNLPSNYGFVYLSPSVQIGNPKSFFVSIPVGIVLSKTRHGIYRNYDVTANGTTFYYGAILFRALKTDFSSKLLQGIYAGLGIQRIRANIYSKASHSYITNQDTTSYFENSRTASIVINAEIMLELFSLGKQNKFRSPFVIKTGYNLQITEPKWSGVFQRDAGYENPDVNLGGFYVRIGFSFWLAKDEFKSWFKS